MEYLEIWNEIVEWSKNNRSALEDGVQSEWEDYFADSEFFGYSKKRGEIDNKRSIILGSTKRVIPDIIIRKDNKDLFVIELKQLCKSFEEKFREQLFSYLKQLELNIGILVCQNIYVYVFKGNGDYSYIKIPFVKDSQDGAKFVELFSRANFDKEKIEDFIESKTNKDKNIKEIKECINSEYIIDLIKKDLSHGYADDEIDEALKGFDISVTKKDNPAIVPSNFGGYAVKNTKGSRSGKNKKKIMRLVHGLKISGQLTDDMLIGFQNKDYSKKNLGLQYKLLTVDPNEVFDKMGHSRYYPKDTIDINGTTYYICSQWWDYAKPYRDAFAEKHGIDLEDTKYDNYF